MSPFHHRTPNAIGAALEDERFTVEIIADGIHAHPAAVRLLTRIKGAGQVALITDSIAAAGLPDGAYPLADGPITVANGSARLADCTLAGSVLTMDRGVANLLNFAAATLNDAVQMASTTPARLLGLGQRKGDIAPGYDADLVALDHQLRVQWTMVGGRLVYSQP